MFNPAKASVNIKEEFIDYITTTFSFADPLLREQFQDQLSQIVSNGPWLEVNDIFKTGASMNELINDKVLSALFRELESGKPIDKAHKKILPLDRKLFLHQEKAIRRITAGKNAVVSTGTGSGKTNCFLIPVINDLLREKEAGTLGPGIRALFIYPMNALANDQMKNLRHLLMYYPDITFGIYTGATEHNEDDAINVYKAMFKNEDAKELREKLPNELLSREEMKQTPPNILFTNYAMLEHLLLRPDDDVLFKNSDFKFVVLDEAHVYAGATGIETSLLLRRLRARITSSRKTQFILTSATLGSEESNGDVVKFAKNLCGVDFDVSDVIRGERVEFSPNLSSINYPFSIFKELADESNYVVDVLKKYKIPVEEGKSENELLYDFLNSSSLYQFFRLKTLANNVIKLSEIEELLDIDEDTTISFVALCTKASKNGASLVDARYHFFIRCLEGCFLALSPDKKLFLTRQKDYKEDGEDYVVFEVAICHDCGRYAFVGREEDNHLIQTAKLSDKVDYYFLANEESGDDEFDGKKLEHMYLCPHCGYLATPLKLIKGSTCGHDSKDYVEVVKARKLDSGYARCGNCNVGEYHRFYLGNEAATGVLATSLYEELPETTYEESDSSSSETSKKSIFSKTLSEKKKKEVRRKGRQFLSFSDSRQEAAKFACYMSKSYAEFLRRRGIYQLIEEKRLSMINDPYTISEFVMQLTSLFANKKTFAESYSDTKNLTVISRKNAWIAMLNELARFSSSTSLTSLGVLQFSYLGNTSELVEAVVERYGVSADVAKNLLDLLAFEVVKMGAICTDSDTDIDDDDRQYIFYSSSQRFVKLFKSDDDLDVISSWLPKAKPGKSGEYFSNNRMSYIMESLHVSQQEAYDFLEIYFNDVLIGDANDYSMIDKNQNGTYVLPAKFFVVRIAGDHDTKWYKCSRCGKVSQFNLNNKCVTTKCLSPVVEVDPESLHADNHFAKLYFNNRMAPLFIKEHTAQLSKKESAKYQQQFIKKEINALSCSTTFEMGVDVGDLETVFLRDVPPLPSNYTQRAGRAGRSVEAAAYCLTYAKLSSHDLSFYKEPDKIISGIILPPMFKIDNEKITRRHIYAVALSMFFAMHPNQYNHNNADEFINKKGYILFIDWIKTKPDALKQMLKQSIPAEENLHQRMGIDDFSWIENFSGKEGTFTTLITNYENNIKEFEKTISQLTESGDIDRAGRMQSRLKLYKYNKLIEFLARGNILPRYGFPVDTVELEQNSTAKNIDKLRLSRDLSVAIAEYAPSSEVVADGRLYTSRYIKKPNIGTDNKQFHINYIGLCDKCDCVVYSETPVGAEGKPCPSCGKLLYAVDFVESIEPRDGFVAEKESKDVPLTRQEKNYRSEDYYIGDKGSKTINKYKFFFNDVEVIVESTTNDSLLVKSTNNFYVCDSCGFAYAEDENIPNDKDSSKKMREKCPSITPSDQHISWFNDAKCKHKKLDRYSLHHTFFTDVAKLNFKCDTSNKKTMVSVMYAILYAIAGSMEIERKDIRACLSQKSVNGVLTHSIIIYDAVPGGAGHARRIVTEDGKALYGIIKTALENMKSCTCNPSCYKCLRSYENQKIHEDLDRKLAIDFLSQFIGDIKIGKLGIGELPNNDPDFDNTKDYIFVSYAHDNRDVALPIIKELRKKYNVWYDNDIKLGTPWPRELADRIDSCSLFLSLISKEYMVSEYCGKEIQYASNCKKTMLLVRIDNETLKSEYKFLYSGIQMLEFTDHTAIDTIVDDIEKKAGTNIKKELQKTQK